MEHIRTPKVTILGFSDNGIASLHLYHSFALIGVFNNMPLVLRGFPTKVIGLRATSRRRLNRCVLVFTHCQKGGLTLTVGEPGC